MIKSLTDFVYKKSVFLYGTGIFSAWMSNYLKRNKVEISGYIVSNKPVNGFFSNKPVFGIEDIKLSSNDCIIVAVIKKDYVGEIKILIKRYVSNSCVYYPEENEDLKKFCIKCFQKERKIFSKKRKKIDIFNYKELARPFPFRSPMYFQDVGEFYGYYWCISYGIDRCVKKYLKSSSLDRLESTVAHGVRYSPRFTYRELNPPNHSIFCMSDVFFRDANDKKCKNNIYSIGPYIRWVKPLLSKTRIMKLRQKMGKTLLVVPSHVQIKKPEGNIAYEEDLFIEEIERIKSKYEFKTVILSIGPFTDIDEATNIYKSRQYKLVSSGAPEDVFFLSRLRTFIELSDLAMGNDVWSTFPGYSIALNCPYYHFEQEINYGDAEKHNDFLGLNNGDVGIETSYKNEFLYCFGSYSESISKKQREFTDKYWGVKSKLRKR